MTLDDALRIIGPEPLRAALAQALRDAHPDTGAHPDPSRVVALNEARRTLLSMFDNEERAAPKNPCTQCGGRGSILQRFGVVACSACGGTGNKL